MKRVVLLFAFLLASACALSQDLTVASYNLRNDNESDRRAGNGWDKRCGKVCEIIDYNGFDIVGTQEVKHGMLLDMCAALPGYGYVGVGRDDGATGGEYSPIFYRRDRFTLLDSGTFWLSPQPDRPGKGWDAAYPRICTWGRFRDVKCGRELWFFNLHMDHIGVEARRESAKLVIETIARMCGAGADVVLTGDFNVDQHNEIYGLLTGPGTVVDSYVTAAKRHAPNGTFNAFDPQAWSDSRIDHLLVSPTWRVCSYAVLTDVYWEEVKGAEGQVSENFPKEVSYRHFEVRLPSDHYPVVVELCYGKR